MLSVQTTLISPAIREHVVNDYAVLEIAIPVFEVFMLLVGNPRHNTPTFCCKPEIVKICLESGDPDVFSGKLACGSGGCAGVMVGIRFAKLLGMEIWQR